MRLRTLIEDARRSAKWRGHDMPRFTHYGKYCAASNCRRYDMQVIANARPAPNEVDIGGEAVALNCEVTN